MDRNNLRHEVFMNSACEQSKLSTCRALKVGAVIVKDNVLMATGYNGVGPGEQHCNELEPMTPDQHKVFSDAYELHAEMNALLNALDLGRQVRGGTLYCTHSPCQACLKHINRAGIKAVFFKNKYWRLSSEELDLMRQTYPAVDLIHIQDVLNN